MYPFAHFVTRVPNIDANQEPLEIEVIIRRGMSLGPIIDTEEPVASDGSGKDFAYAHTLNSNLSDANSKGSPYIHPFSTNLSDANKKGMDNLAYWGNGPKKSKTYLMNKALAQYLAQFKESQQPIPPEEA